MGFVTRNGSKVQRLLLLRNAIEDGDVLPDLPVGVEVVQVRELEVMAVVEGYAADVRCSVCGSIRSWFPGRRKGDA